MSSERHFSWAKFKPVSGTEPRPAGKNDWTIHVGDRVIMYPSFVAVRGY